ncbi:hypothetical protein H0H81_000957, partial [Sphagnurus paluster]
TFGLILTKLRNRLGTQKLLDLAELKMHIRDEQMLLKKKSKLRERAFGVRAEAISRGRSNLPSAPVPPTSPPAVAQASTADEDSPDAPVAETLNAIDDAGDEDHSINFTSPKNISISLKNLFDFNSTHWVEAQQRSAIGSLEEEFEVYDLLDLDAEGEQELDLDPDLDDIVESVLSA